MKRVHMEVCPQQNDKYPWRVTVDSQCMESFPTQNGAIDAAVAQAHAMEAEGRLVTLKIKRPDGTVRDERTYPRSSDPVETEG